MSSVAIYGFDRRELWKRVRLSRIDAAALFLCALTETENWTHDHKLADELWPAAEAAPKLPPHRNRGR